MDYTEAKLRIIRKLPDDFLSDDKNREALNILEFLFNSAETSLNMSRFRDVKDWAKGMFNNRKD